MFEFAGACIVVSFVPINKSYLVESVVFGTTHAITSPSPLVYDTSQFASAVVGILVLFTNVIVLIKSAVYFLLPDLLAPIA